jgi:succinate dehydrogenase flavin-adding protein (antitoxin of CptAB toxin-antitoxin module)
MNKLLYRSKQRGWLELDLLMGLWAEQHVPSMSTDMLRQYAAVLDQVGGSEMALQLLEPDTSMQLAVVTAQHGKHTRSS